MLDLSSRGNPTTLPARRDWACGFANADSSASAKLWMSYSHPQNDSTQLSAGSKQGKLRSVSITCAVNCRTRAASRVDRTLRAGLFSEE